MQSNRTTIYISAVLGTDAHWVVTEYDIIDLTGLSLREQRN